MSLFRYFAYTFLFCLIVSLPASAAPLTITKEKVHEGVISMPVPVLEDETKSNSSIQAAVQASRLQQSGRLITTQFIKFGPMESTFWIVLNVTNHSNYEQWWFDLLPATSNQASPVRSMALYDPEDPLQKPLATWPENADSARNPSLPVTLKPGQTTTRYVLVQTWSGLDTTVVPHLKTQRYMDSLSTNLAQKAGFLWLIMGAVFGIGIVQLILTRQSVQGVLAMNALIIGVGTFFNQRSELIPNISNYHPIYLPLVTSCVFGIAASFMLWVASRAYSDKAKWCTTPIMVNILILLLAVVKLDILTTNIDVEMMPHYLLTLTGLALFGITVVLGFANISLYWFIPPWLALTAMPWLSSFYPYFAPVLYVILLGVAGVASVFWHWKTLNDETASLQRRLRQELKSFKDKFQEEEASWTKKMENQRALLNELRAVEQQRSAELEIARREADTANKAKSDFLAIISHEIRTPMNGIMGIVQVLNETPMNDKQREYIDVIKNSGDTMVTLLNDILDYSKIEKGVIELENIPFSLRKLAQSVATLMSGRAKDKGLAIHVDIPDTVAETLKGDPGRIRQILLNLASNAVKFTEKGSVTIRVRKGEEDPSMLRFEVIDTGMGISQEAQNKLFQAYVQADASISRRYGGTGLGLNICRMLVTAMEGQIGLISTEGSGSTFWFEIPLQVANTAALETRKENDSHYAPAKKLHILAIDDNEINLKIVSSLLEMDGHTVVIADNGEKGLQLVEEQPFDAVFVDILMPGMDGKTFLKKLRQNDSHRISELPVFALTGMVDPESVEQMLASGLMDVIGKPVTKTALRNAIQKVIGKAEPINHEASVDDLISQMQNMSPEDVEKLRQALMGSAASAAPAPVATPAPVPVVEEKPDLSLLNMNILGELKGSLPVETVKEIFDDLIIKAKELTTLLEEAAKDKDIEDMNEQAHNLKGMAGNFGMQGLMDHSGKIEHAARQGDKDKAAALVADSRSVLDRSLKALDHWMSS